MRAADTFGASASLPAYLSVAGEVLMGTLTTLSLDRGQAALVHTGGMIPAGADAVVIVEDTQVARPDEIEVLKPAAPGQNVFQLGEDVQPGEIVLDIGSGGGLDAFLAAQKVGPTGKVIGVDMTPAMLERARRSAARAGLEHVEFRQGMAESQPIENAWVDVTSVGSQSHLSAPVVATDARNTFTNRHTWSCNQLIGIGRSHGSSRAEVVNFFGQMQIPRWQIWDEVHQHTMWTAGQIVSNFRKHDMAPPGFAFF